MGGGGEEGEEERSGEGRGRDKRLTQGGFGCHSIVGKGNHSANHVQKLKPAVERICREQGLHFVTEENAGRIYVDLTGGAAVMPNYPGQGQPYGNAGYSQQPHQQQHQQGHGAGQYYAANGGATYPGQQQGQYGAGYQSQGQGQGQGNDPNAEIEAVVKKFLPRILRRLEGCCVVM